MMGTLLQDLRFAVRSLRRHPLFTITGLLTLALGIGLNTAVFSAVEALLFRPLGGARAPEEIVQVYRTWPGGGIANYGNSSVPHFRDVQAQATDVFSGVAAWNLNFINLSFGGQNQRVLCVMASASYFSTLGVEMLRGRGFSVDEDVGVSAHPVVVLGYSAWQRTFGSDPQIVGKTVIMNGQANTVIGVAPPAFNGVMPMLVPALYIPFSQVQQVTARDPKVLEDRGENAMNVVARLKPGVTVAQASDRLATINRQLLEAYPKAYEGSGMLLVRQSEAGIHPSFRQTQVQMTSLVMAVVAMLLLITCVNVANLFLARASERSREMAVRLSIGAERSRLIRQLLTESVLFAVVAGIIGLVVAAWAIGIANGIRIPMDLDMQPDLRLSLPVLGFTFLVSLAVGVMFGLAPALQATRPALVPALKGEAPAGGSRSRLSAPLVVGQMALSLILLTCAGLFLNNIKKAAGMDKGFNADHVLLATVDPSLQGYSRSRADAFYARLLERVRTLPGVEGAALVDNLPLGLSNNDADVKVDGYTPSKDESISISYSVISPAYFETLRVPMKKGRTFTERDDSAAAPVLIVNQRFVERFLNGRDPIGARVHTRGIDATIVGVTSTGKYRSLGEDPTPYVYAPLAQTWHPGMTVVIRATGDPLALAPALRTEVAALDPQLPLSDVKSMGTHLGIALLPSRIAGTALGVFGILGLLLAAVGIYGVMSYSVSQRTREIGIRMAIGSSRQEVVRLVIGQGMKLVGIGLGIGLAGAFGAARLVRGLLYGQSASDPVTIAVVSVVLTGVALLATWIPARRASAIDPLLAMRAE